MILRFCILGAVLLMILFETLLSSYFLYKCRVDNFDVVVDFFFRNSGGVSFNFCLI